MIALFHVRRLTELQPKFDAKGSILAYANFDYSFNDQMQGGSFGQVGVRIHAVHEPTHKVVVLELWQPGSIAAAPNDSGSDKNGNWAILPMMTNRHGGMANCGFLDGHVEVLDPNLFDGRHWGSKGTATFDNPTRWYFSYVNDKFQ